MASLCCWRFANDIETPPDPAIMPKEVHMRIATASLLAVFAFLAAAQSVAADADAGGYRVLKKTFVPKGETRSKIVNWAWIEVGLFGSKKPRSRISLSMPA